MVKEPITKESLQQHLDGTITLGVPSISAEQTCRWVCFDDDTDDEERLNRIEIICDTGDIFPIREGAREGRAGHLWLFFDEPVPVEAAYDFGQIVKSGACGQAAIEFFPKQRAVNPGGIGNCVKMPLGIHRKLLPELVRLTFSGCESEDPIEQLNWFCEQPLSSTASVVDFVARHKVVITKPVVKKHTALTFSDLMNLIPDDYPVKELPSGERETRCPLCESEGHDRKGNNLSVNPDRNVMFCHYAGRNHNFTMIVRAFRMLKQQQAAST